MPIYLIAILSGLPVLWWLGCVIWICAVKHTEKSFKKEMYFLTFDERTAIQIMLMLKETLDKRNGCDYKTDNPDYACKTELKK